MLLSHKLCVQGLFISFLVGGGAIDTVRDGKNLQNFLICLEMLLASFGMLIAFPYSEYKNAGVFDILNAGMHQPILQLSCNLPAPLSLNLHHGLMRVPRPDSTASVIKRNMDSGVMPQLAPSCTIAST